MADVKLMLTPYLSFNGNAAEAMRFYKSVIGGELKMETFEEAKAPYGPGEKDRIIHATLKYGDFLLMAADGRADMKVVFGDNVNLSITGPDAERLTGIFNGFAKGGKVTMPLAKQFWGDTFGMLADKFGVHWMISISAQPM
jgi:PhnB protein